MDLYQLCDLRDRLIMDNNYSTEEQTFLFGLLEPHIFEARTTPSKS